MKIRGKIAGIIGIILFWGGIAGAQIREFPPQSEIPRCAGNLEAGQEADKPPDHEIHQYQGFALCYRESYELSEWVAYELTLEELTPVAERSNNFAFDQSISTGSAFPEDYRGSGFDRGHLAPAADMRFSRNAMNQSFYMSNMSPQTPLLNRGVWRRLEEVVRNAARNYGRVLVVTGPVLDREDFPRIGLYTQVAVPAYFYKVLAALIPGEDGTVTLHTIGFIIENENPLGIYQDFAVSVDQVEAHTGLDFFAAFPDDLETAAEQVFDISKW
jgi:endonuclease G